MVTNRGRGSLVARLAILAVLTVVSGNWMSVGFAGEPAEPAGSAGWADLSGRVVYDGRPPRPKSFQVNVDRGALPATITDESLVVDDETGGLANLLIYLMPDDERGLKVHSSYEKTAEDRVKLVMEAGRFKPHVLLLRTSQTMVQENRDQIAYNAKIDFFANSPM